MSFERSPFCFRFLWHFFFEFFIWHFFGVIRLVDLNLDELDSVMVDLNLEELN